MTDDTALADHAISPLLTRRVAEPELADYLRGFERHLMAANRSRPTIDKYTAAVRELIRFLEANGMPKTATGIHREHVEAFLAERVATRAAA